MRRFRRLVSFVFAGALLGLGAVRADSAQAITRLLNSQASGSRRGYELAAEEVRNQAEAGKAVYGYVLALVSREPDPPKAARLDAATRTHYLDDARASIERLARGKDNPMAWYLLSLENNDTNMLHRAAELGNVQALNAWGSLVVSTAVTVSRTTNELAQALSQAYACFDAAARKGDANGFYNLGMCHWRALGVPQDNAKAFDNFRFAAEKGHPEAINNIGAFFRKGIVVTRDPVMSTRWFAKSASYDNPYGLFNYALALQRGEGVEKDPVQALDCMRRAAEGGCVEAMDAYGVALWKGEGVKEPNPIEAVRLFMRAAQAGYPPAMENLSTCYDRGTGVTASAERALEWKIRARAACGDRSAVTWLREHGKNR